MGDGRCVNCRDHEPAFDRAVSYGEYKGGLRGLVHLLKYEGVTPAARSLGAKLAEAIDELRIPEGTTPLLVPVPLHKGRRQTRGFNQAELIAQAATKCFDRMLEIAPAVLVRHRETISQVGLSREERIENMHDAFRVREPERVKGRDVIVVDDVMTTGTTLSECARVLKEAGAERVWAATAARAFHGADLRQDADDRGEEEEIEAAELAASV